jgi:hypothetical protein
VSGIDLNLITTEVQCSRGIITGVYNRVYDTQRGLSIGIFNHADNLHGVQIGVLNFAGNNPEGLKILPLLNVHF